MTRRRQRSFQPAVFLTRMGAKSLIAIFQKGQAICSALCDKNRGWGLPNSVLSGGGWALRNKSLGIKTFADRYTLTLIESNTFRIMGGDPIHSSKPLEGTSEGATRETSHLP